MGPGLSPARGPFRPGRDHLPSIRQGQVTVDGRLSAEVVQRVVRQSFGRFRLCYEQGLRKNPTLEGHVSVKLVIAPDGAVASLGNVGADLNDATTVACVVRAFGGLSFPHPASAVSVIYPIWFFPGDDGPATPVLPRAFTVSKRKIIEVDTETLASMVKRESRLVAVVTPAHADAHADAHAPYALFLRDGENVHVIRRLQSKSKGYVPASRGSERVGLDGWSFRIEGESLSAETLMESLVDP